MNVGILPNICYDLGRASLIMIIMLIAAPGLKTSDEEAVQFNPWIWTSKKTVPIYFHVFNKVADACWLYLLNDYLH